MSGCVSSEASRVQYRRSILEAISGQRFNFLVLGRPRYVSTNSVEAAMTEGRHSGAIETVPQGRYMAREDADRRAKSRTEQWCREEPQLMAHGSALQSARSPGSEDA